MPVRRGTSNSNSRGSAEDRRRRKLWLLANFGNGVVANCVFCMCELTFDTITVDRILPGCQGGRYIRSNIQPACGTCNSTEGGSLRSI